MLQVRFPGIIHTPFNSSQTITVIYSLAKHYLHQINNNWLLHLGCDVHVFFMKKYCCIILIVLFHLNPETLILYIHHINAVHY